MCVHFHCLYVTVFGKTNRLAKKSNFFFIALLPFMSHKDLPPFKFEANLMLHLGVKSASFSLFTLASSCSNAYFRAYAIIDFLSDRLVFLNTVTYGLHRI